MAGQLSQLAEGTTRHKNDASESVVRKSTDSRYVNHKILI
jgi:hypothetical protein